MLYLFLSVNLSFRVLIEFKFKLLLNNVVCELILFIDIFFRFRVLIISNLILLFNNFINFFF